MNRGRAVGGSQAKTMLGIHGRVLLEPEVLHRSIFIVQSLFRSRENFSGLPFLSFLAFFSIAMRAFLFKLIIAEQPAGQPHQADIQGNPFVDGKPLGFELAQDLGVDLFYGGFAQQLAEA